MGCSDDEGISYPTSDAPEIKVLRDELYSNPNRKFVIKADLKDDLGLKSLKIVIPEFYLDKEIVFPTDTLVTEYELAYEFLAPKDTKNEDVYKSKSCTGGCFWKCCDQRAYITFGWRL